VSGCIMHCPEEAFTGVSSENFGPRCGASTPAARTHLERTELSCNVFVWLRELDLNQ
jgi:hypothetical protein